MASDYSGRVRFVSENYGDSKLAERFGVRRYPAIFVNDVLVATPKDFGFFGKDEGADSARYAPIRGAVGQERFRADLKRMIELVLAGKSAEARAAAPSATAAEITRMPELVITDFAGRPLSRAELADRVVLIEFWATWCPPCRSTLRWLGALGERYGDRLAIVTLAMDSDEAQARATAKEIGPAIRWAVGTPALAREFGGIGAVPTLFLFDRRGATAAVFYGAPPTLHEHAEARLRALLD